MDHEDRIDQIEAAFKATTWSREFQVSTTFYAARQFAGYKGTSYLDALAALATKYVTEEEIKALPRTAALARS